ncbi:hypothetical protein [Trichormus azollae]|uniref:hypothetical protein n=1 Tax=Trichormus azollae TaxID=1164 RepID=UPI00325DB72E
MTLKILVTPELGVIPFHENPDTYHLPLSYSPLAMPTASKAIAIQRPLQFS